MGAASNGVDGVWLCYLNNLSTPHTSDCHSPRTQLVHAIKTWDPRLVPGVPDVKSGVLMDEACLDDALPAC